MANLGDVSKAVEYAKSQDELITYDQLDCQGWVEQIQQVAGAEIPNYAGSNDMYRNMCGIPYTIEEAKRLGMLAEGWIMFQVKHDNLEPEQYKDDNFGNASHVGFYLGDGETSESGMSLGGVHTTTRGIWTHCGKSIHMNYTQSVKTRDIAGNNKSYVLYRAIVETDENGLKLREKAMKKSIYKVKVPQYATIDVLEKTNDVYWKIRFGDLVGYVDKSFLKISGTASQTASTAKERLIKIQAELAEIISNL